MNSTLLETRQITRRFGGLVAVDSVDLEIADGEVHGLIGPNGAGKTTMLNLLSGHLASSSGSILFAGTDVTRHAAEKRAIAGIRRTFQNLKLFKELPALDNVMVGLHANTRAEVFHALLRTPFQRREEREIVEKAREALDFVGLGTFADKAAGSLPYGHQRLLEIARAFVARPKLLLLDEPAAGLNGAESKTLVDLIRRIRAEGITIVLVEHHMDVVMPTCDRITVLNYGKLLAKGRPAEIRHNSEVIGAYLGKGSALKRERAAPGEVSHAAS
jgi:branched-chain amino acid transport system ATP-binding protein